MGNMHKDYTLGACKLDRLLKEAVGTWRILVMNVVIWFGRCYECFIS